MKIGYKLAAEAYGPKDLVAQAVRAEQAGFDFVEISDHYHPWVDEQGHSPFAWTVLGAIAARTTTLGLATGVTCPTVRYHPAIIAQAAATLAVLSDGRFTLGVGSGERLNEHIVGFGFPESVEVRHEMLVEALEIIRMLWDGGYRSYQGKHFELASARVWDLPDRPPLIAVAAGGPRAARLAAEHGDGLFTTEPDPSLAEAYRSHGGSGPHYAEMPLSWAKDEQTAVTAAHKAARWSTGGWPVMAELPNPPSFDAASQTVTEDDMREAMTCGSDPSSYVSSAQTFVDAGADHLVMTNWGPDPEGFLEFYSSELDGKLRALSPS
ncbi:TIGR03557 family F420-dependent LLM class oxidoreductase [Actinomadura logoneensis]|uniref:TIGR03557 family F420-dependent LLM class oxidoreductase n=1 Tax=Actinomadura logoneensis TaxID=2293572 RepID=A0A372JJA6_9ACTN|nr:TIGR03557 family F420-dependent LLM class oxidoreductase [Actinomadura logoneensis]RFU40030.1 TIGR03557 family F420-dependent LLM class oxidoreductase [Actinomadura logoneensis]